MKRVLVTKFILIILFSLLNLNYLYAKEPWELLLSKRSASGNDMYNLTIDDYNKFKDQFFKEVLRHCTDQMVAGGGWHQLLTIEKCKYRSAVDLAKKHRLHYGKFREYLYSWHKDVFPTVKNHVVALIECNSESCTRSVFNSLKKIKNKGFSRLFNNLDRVTVQMADKENRKYYAKKKKKEEESGPKIDDNEIIAASSGTGFFVSKEGHMVTNYHVIEGCSIVKAIYNGNEFESKVLAIDKINDLAIIKANINSKKAYAVSNEGVQFLEEIRVAGYPLGKKVSQAIKASKGTVTALAGIGDNYSEFQIDAALNSGNSGGPIINDKGNVVGVAVSKIQKEGVEGFNFGIKSSVLKTFANSNGIKFLPPNNNEMKQKDLGALIIEATIYLDCWMTGKEIKKLIAQSQKSQKAFYSDFIK